MELRLGESSRGAGLRRSGESRDFRSYRRRKQRLVMIERARIGIRIGRIMTEKITVPRERVSINGAKICGFASSDATDSGIGSSQPPEIDCFRVTNADMAQASFHVHMVLRGLYLWLCRYHVVTTFIIPLRTLRHS